jgi:hypothetical protein
MSFIGQNIPAPTNPAHQMPMDAPQGPGQAKVGKPTPAGFNTPNFTPNAGQPLPGMPGQKTGLEGTQLGPAKGLDSLRSLLDSQGAIKPNLELSECGDVDINIHSKTEVICPDFLQDFHKNIGKAFAGDKIGLQEKALDLIKGVKDSIVTGQKKTLPGIFKNPEKIKPGLFDKGFGWLKTPVQPGVTNKLPPQAEVKVYEFASQTLPQDPMAFVQWVLRESYMENTQSLYDYAEKVRWFNEQKKAVREELEGVRNHMAAYPGAEDGDQIAPYQTREYNLEYTGDMDPNAASDRIKNGEWGQTIKHGAIVTESGTGTAAAQAAAQAQSAQAKADAADAAYQSDAAATLETSFKPASYSRKYNHGGSDDYKKFDSTATKAGKDLSETKIAAMSEEEKAALLDYYASNGLHVDLKCYETDKINDKYYDTQSLKTYPKPGESLEDFVKRASGAQMTEFKNKVKSEEGDINIEYIKVDVHFPEVSVTQPKYSVAQLSQMHPESPAAQGAAVSSVAGTNSGENFAMGEVADTYGEMETYKTNLEETLNTLGDDAQLANVDLQNWLQKQQQTLQMMSNISKLLHDTAMNTIRKLGG